MDLLCCTPAKVLRRRDVAATNPVKYHFIDFEVSRKVDDATSDPKEFLFFGLDDDLPELYFSEPYSPFPVDIFMLGNVYKKRLVQVRMLQYLKDLA
jgi:hypothetical protein